MKRRKEREEPVPIDELVREMRHPMRGARRADASYAFDEDAMQDDYSSESWPGTWPLSGRKEA